MAENDGYVRHKAYLDVLEGELWLAEDSEGRLYFPLRASCGYLGIDYSTSLAAIKDDSRLTPGLRQIQLPTPGGPQVQQCLRKLEYTWWLSLLDPRRFKEERRARISERQRVLMEFAEDVILSQSKLEQLARWRQSRQTAAAEVSSSVEAHFRCLKCGAPHVAVIDGSGLHLHLGVPIGGE